MFNVSIQILFISLPYNSIYSGSQVSAPSIYQSKENTILLKTPLSSGTQGRRWPRVKQVSFPKWHHQEVWGGPHLDKWPPLANRPFTHSTGLTKGPKAGRAGIPFLILGTPHLLNRRWAVERGQFAPQGQHSDSSCAQLASNLGVLTCELTASEDLRDNTGVKQTWLWTWLCLDLGLSVPPLHQRTGWEDTGCTKASLVFNHSRQHLLWISFCLPLWWVSWYPGCVLVSAAPTTR